MNEINLTFSPSLPSRPTTCHILGETLRYNVEKTTESYSVVSSCRPNFQNSRVCSLKFGAMYNGQCKALKHLVFIVQSHAHVD